MAAQFVVVLPEGVTSGQSVQVTTPDGQAVEVVVPPNTIPGQQIAVQYTPIAQSGPSAPLVTNAALITSGQAAPVQGVATAPPLQYMPRQPQPGVAGPHTAYIRVDPQPGAQFAFMWGWLGGCIGIPCVCCSTCAGYLMNRISPQSFINNRRDQEAATYVDKAARTGCGFCILLTIAMFAFYGFTAVVAVNVEEDMNNEVIGLLHGGFFGLWTLVVCLSCCANIVPVVIGLQMHRNDDLIRARQASGEMPSGPIHGLVGAEMSFQA